MNILPQCCGVTLMIVVLLFHNSHKKVHLHTEQAFMQIWIVTFVSLLLDIISMVLLTCRDALPEIVVRAGCKAYIASLVWVGIAYVNYVCIDIYEEWHKKNKKPLILCGMILLIGVYVLPLYIRTEGKTKTYTYGPAANFAYIIAGSVLFVIGYLLHKHRKTVKTRLRRVMRVWIGVWLVAAVIQFISIQFLNNALLLAGYASALGMVIFYLRLENPETNLDWETGFFNQNAFLAYITLLLDQDTEFYLLYMSYSLGIGDNVPSNTEKRIRKEISQYTLSIKGINVFRIMENDFIFLFFDKEEKERVYERLSARFEKPWGRENMRMVSPQWYDLEHTGIVNCAEDFLLLFPYMRQRNSGKRSSENNFVTIDDATIHDLYREREVENLLLRAMEEDRVEVFFQPIYSTETNQFVSAEALVRIRDEKDEIVLPGMFIEVAEKTGLITKLGDMVFERVCQFIQKENPKQFGIKYIEVNLSLIQCGYESLAGNFIQIMKKYEILPEHITLEITETASLDGKQILLQNMKDLRRFGVSFALDDFGTGRSNLNYIVDMPVDIVKFDKDMIQSYFQNDKAKYVMDAAMHMIHGMQLQIVSEGVETEEQYTTMEELGISYIQGYYFSKPLPEKEFLEFIRQQA